MSWFTRLWRGKKKGSQKPAKIEQINAPTPPKLRPARLVRRICIDAGHGMSNGESGVFDPGACSNGAREADIALTYALTLRREIIKRGHEAVMTRTTNALPTPLRHRAGIAKANDCDAMVSLHCNAANGRASGSEVFYRGAENREKAANISHRVAEVFDIPDRGAKTEQDSARGRLAVMGFQPCFLIELGFIDHDHDRRAMIEDDNVFAACKAIADEILK